MQTEGGPKNINTFRYKTVEEASIWDSHIENISPQKALLFYAILEEIRILLESKAEEAVLDKQAIYEQNAILAILGLFSHTILNEELLNKFTIFGEDGEDILRLLKLSYEFGRQAKSCFVGEQNGEWSIEYHADSAVSVFESSEFIKNQQSFFDKSNMLLMKISDSDVLSNFFSIMGVLNKRLSGLFAQKETTIAPLDFLFFEKEVAWCEPGGRSSLFSVIFSPLLTVENRETVEVLELSRVYLKADKADRAQVRHAALLHSLEVMMNKNVLATRFAGEVGKRLSSILLMGGEMGEVRRFFCAAYNRKIINLNKRAIERIVEEEMVEISTDIRERDKRGDINDEIAIKFIEIFFLNIFTKVEKLLSKERPLVYHDGYTKEDMAEYREQVGTIIKYKIKEVKETRGWVWED
ncbi:MAG: hypothetical protein IE916_00210 [Epsilonproteobacteria bacterium]|nr:hypothetical protein [Campylobacterota bacterium]